jgi:hypothetical protein
MTEPYVFPLICFHQHAQTLVWQSAYKSPVDFRGKIEYFPYLRHKLFKKFEKPTFWECHDMRWNGGIFQWRSNTAKRKFRMTGSSECYLEYGMEWTVPSGNWEHGRRYPRRSDCKRCSGVGECQETIYISISYVFGWETFTYGVKKGKSRLIRAVRQD